MSIELQKFLNLSVELCGFSEFTLRGTGYAQQYYNTVVQMVGTDFLGELLTAYSQLPGDSPEVRDRAICQDILSDEKIGPIARSIIKLWFTAIWFELPPEWHQKFQTKEADRRFIPFTYAYPEGLLGPAVGAHVQGAKPQGYGTWAKAPEILEFDGDPMIIEIASKTNAAKV
jgi:hypothetical protein